MVNLFDEQMKLRAELEEERECASPFTPRIIGLEDAPDFRLEVNSLQAFKTAAERLIMFTATPGANNPASLYGVPITENNSLPPNTMALISSCNCPNYAEASPAAHFARHHISLIRFKGEVKDCA